MQTVAIIGCGKSQYSGPGRKVGWGIAGMHAGGYRAAFPAAALHAVDPNAENLRAFADEWQIPPERCFASTQALYAALTPDAVSVCTWPALHAAQVIEACGRGVKAVTCEKPLALDGFQIQEMIDAARRSGTRVAVAHQRRYAAAFTKARELIAAGTLGEQLFVEGRVGDDWDILSWTVHWFDMANYLLDATPQWVLAGVEHTGQRRYGHAVENASVILVQYGEGRQGLFVTGPATVPQPGISIRGEKGMAFAAEASGTVTVFDARGQTVHEGTPPSGNVCAALLADLWATVGTTNVSRCGIERCAVATQMAYAAHESARTHKKVPLPLHAWYAPLEVMERQPMPTTPWPRGILAMPQAKSWPRLGCISAGMSFQCTCASRDPKWRTKATGSLPPSQRLPVSRLTPRADESHSCTMASRWRMLSV